MKNTTADNNNSHTAANLQVSIDTWADMSRMTQDHQKMTVDNDDITMDHCFFHQALYKTLGFIASLKPCSDSSRQKLSESCHGCEN